MKIDIHTHILPEKWPDLCERYGYDGFVRLDHHKPCRARMMSGNHFFREIESNCWDPEKRIEECDVSAVDVQVLSTVPVMFSYWAKPQDVLDLSKMLNDHIAGVVAQFPTRFVGLGTVPMQSPELAIKELERCVKDIGLAGIQIGTHVNGGNLDEPAVFSVLEAAASLGAAVFVHPWDMLGKERMTHYWLPWLVGMPADTAVAICSVIFGGVLERLPALRLCFAHGGGSFPGTVGRIEHGFHVRPDLCATRTQRNPREMLDKFYVDSLVHDETFLRYLISLMGIERIALGTDYPFPLGELAPGKLIESMADLTAPQKEQLLSGTALEFLGLDKARFRQ